MIKGRALFAPAFFRLRTLGPETFVLSPKMIICQPPIKMLGQLSSIVSRCPGTARELGDRLADGKVGALDKGGCDVGLRT